uniref:Uncharacterized protein TCIL3000_8_1310 n=1 Tax=Trypanosoma congolense (strain IL3000) TaxID=1068625 RepID=G0URA4_TRYCI|nr:unnamed protein product [Trypanosoma congolense IL3000]
MALPAADVRLLANISRRLQGRTLHTYVPGEARTSVAIILRFGDEHHQLVARRLLTGATATDVPRVLQQHLSAGAGESVPSSLTVLFVKRADLSGDRWSGSVTFPGGRRDLGDVDDYNALCCRVDEMLGIPLRSPEFLLLGRLRDYPIRSRKLQMMGAVQARFVFLHTGQLTPALRFAAPLVEAVRWVPVNIFAVEQPHTRCRVCHPVASFVRPTDADTRLLLTEVFPNAHLSFPAVQLPGAWRVWGLALRSTYELMTLDDRLTADWPLLTSNSALLQHFIIDPLHGYYEALFTYYWLVAQWRQKGKGTTSALSRHDVIPHTAHPILWAVPEAVSPRHITFLAVDVALVLLVVYSVAAAIHVAYTILHMALGRDENEKTR